MKLDIIRRRPHPLPGRVYVTVQVTTHAGKPQLVDVDTDEPTGHIAVNELGYAKTTAGEWVSTMRDVDGQFVFTPDPAVDWERKPVPDGVIEKRLKHSPELRPHLHRHVVEHCADVGFGEYTHDTIRVVPHGPVHIDPRTGMVEVAVDAYDAATGKKLYVHDGVYQFDRMPTTVDGADNPAASLRVYLARVIAGQNGREVS